MASQSRPVTAWEFLDAARKGDERTVQRGLSQQPPCDINATDEDGHTALHWAIFYEREAVALLLIGRGASVNTANCRKATPLHAAAMQKAGQLIVLALLQRANYSTRTAVDCKGQTVLHYLITNIGEGRTYKSEKEAIDWLKIWIENGAAPCLVVQADVGTPADQASEKSLDYVADFLRRHTSRHVEKQTDTTRDVPWEEPSDMSDQSSVDEKSESMSGPEAKRHSRRSQTPPSSISASTPVSPPSLVSLASGLSRTPSTSSIGSPNADARECYFRAQTYLATSPLITALDEASKAVQLSKEAYPEAYICRSYTHMMQGQYEHALNDVERARKLIDQGRCETVATTTQCDVLKAAINARVCCKQRQYKQAVSMWTQALTSLASTRSGGSMPAWSWFGSLEYLSYATFQQQRGLCHAHLSELSDAIKDLGDAVNTLVLDYRASGGKKLSSVAHLRSIRRVLDAVRTRAMVYMRCDQFARAQIDLAAEMWWRESLKMDLFECDTLLHVTQDKCRDAWSEFAEAMLYSEAVPSGIVEGQVYDMEFDNVTHPFSEENGSPLLVSKYQKVRTFRSKEKPVLVDLYVKGYGVNPPITGEGRSQVSDANPHPIGVIVKPGDLRPDITCMELIREFNAIWNSCPTTFMGAPVRLVTYQVVQVKDDKGKSARGVGLIEAVTNVTPFTDLAKWNNSSLSKVVKAYWTDKRIASFMASVVASFAVLRVLGIRDRHADNFLIRNFTPPGLGAAATPTSAAGRWFKQRMSPASPPSDPPPSVESVEPDSDPELVVIDFGFWCNQKPYIDTDPLPFTNSMFDILQLKTGGWEMWKTSFHAALEHLMRNAQKLIDTVERVAAHEHKEMLRGQIKEALFLNEDLPKVALTNFIGSIPKEKKFNTAFKMWLHSKGKLTS